MRADRGVSVGHSSINRGGRSASCRRSKSSRASTSATSAQAGEWTAAPSLPIERGIAGPGLLAQILVAKFADHQPLYRQSAIYARHGVELDHSTMAPWCARWSMRRRRTSSRQARFIRTIHPCRCSRPATFKPRPDACGCTCARTVVPV